MSLCDVPFSFSFKLSDSRLMMVNQALKNVSQLWVFEHVVNMFVLKTYFCEHDMCWGGGFSDLNDNTSRRHTYHDQMSLCHSR